MIDLEQIKKAIAYTQAGKFEEACAIYNHLLSNNSDNPDLLSIVGLFYVNIGDFEKASEILEKACNIKKTLGTVSALGFAEFERKDYKKAAEILENSLEYGENADIYNKLIISLFEIKNYKRAVEYADKMYTLYPEDYRAISNKVKALTQSGKLMDAQQLCIEAINKNPDISVLWFQLGFLKELIYSDDKQARECYKAAADLGNPDADYNIAVSCVKLGEFEEAEKYYKKMLEKSPDDIDTMTSLGMCYLTQRKFKKGYDLFFRRDKSHLKDKTKNPWQVGDKIEDNVIVMCDQGFGDHIQFIRYLPFVPAKHIQVAVPKTLKEIFSKNYPDVEFIDYDEINLEIQSMRVTDLAYILNMDFDHIPFSSGYLKSSAAEIKNKKLKVGLCWEAGSAGIRTMINRTIHIICFEPILNLENIQVYSFQVDDTFSGCVKYPQMINLGKDFKSFADTAKALMAMDVLVTVDTSVAHLAGALGIKTYLLLPYASDWRWFRDTKTTPWYDSVEIFKQIDHISWKEPIDKIVEKLKAQK